MTGRPVGLAGRRNPLVLAIVCVVLVGGGLASVRASAAEPEDQQALAQRLCRLRWWDARESERAAIEQVIRDRSDRQVADLERQATSGLAVAQCALGVLYDEGLGVPHDYEQAAAWYRKAAEQGNAWAQVKLGWLYVIGQGVPHDYEQAAAWYRKAAEQGDALAQFRLGHLYEGGWGVPQDYEQAAAWYRKAAEQGFASAQFGLGVLYAGGRGVPRDSAQAAAWYRKAAEQGLAVAQCVLGLLYADGRGVPQDFVLAYLWASLAASQKSECAEDRDRIAQKMTPQQIAEAQRLAREWKPRTSAPSDRLEGPGERPVASHGTGFVVSRQGHVLTAHHVVAGCRTIQASVEGRTLPLTVVATDPTNDVAVLKLSQPLPHTARFRAGRSIRPGEGVVVIGFPLAGLLAAQPQVTTGVVSALAGIGNDTRLLQITAPVQPGNSGGPLLDQSGAVVGMVVSKLDAIQLAKLTGDLPQNVNFALTGAVLKAVLDAAPVAYEEAASSRRMETVDLADQARHFTLALECR